MWYPSHRTDSTQGSAPIVCQCLQCADRQPPTRNRGETLSGGLFPGAFLFATRTAGAAEKGALTLRPLRFQPCWVEEEEGSSKPAAATEAPQVRHHQGQQRRQMKTVQTKTSEESSEDATSAEQERRSKLCASWLGQSQEK